MENEIKMLFELAYLPVVHQNQRLNGGDFLKVAFDIMDALRKQQISDLKINDSARTLVHCFNNLLNPKMSLKECDDMTHILINNNPLIRGILSKS